MIYYKIICYKMVLRSHVCCRAATQAQL